MARIFNVNYGGSYGSRYEFMMDAYETDINNANNTSLVTAYIYVRRTDISSSGAYNNNGTPWSITIDGSSYSGSATFDTRNSTDWKFLGSASKTITHNSDGTKSISLSGSHSGTPMGSASGSGTFDLTQIPRYMTVTNEFREKSSTTIGINFGATSVIATDAVQYSLNDGSWQSAKTYRLYMDPDGQRGYYTIPNLTPGTTYKIKTRCQRADSGLWSESSSISVQTYYNTVASISLSSKTSTSLTVSSSCNVAVSSTRYRIKLATASSYGSWQTSNVFTGLTPNTAYDVQVEKVATESGYAGYADFRPTTYKKTIPTISLSSKTVDTITVSSSCNISVSSTKYRIKTSSGSYGSYQTSNVFTGLTPNTSYVIEVQKVGSENNGETGTATLSVTTYDYAKLSTVPNINLGDNLTITFSNPSGATVYGTVYYGNEISLASYRVVSGTSYTFNFTDNELDTIYKLLSNKNSITLRVYLRLDTNTNSYYNYKEFTLTLKGNQKCGHINVNGTWKRTKKWVNVNGTWKRCIRWVNVNGTWKRCI